MKKLLISLGLVAALLAGCGGEGADDPALDQPADVEQPAPEQDANNAS